MPSTHRENGSRAKSWRVESRISAVGTRRRMASRADRVTQSLGMGREVAAQLLHQSAHGPGAERPSERSRTPSDFDTPPVTREVGRAALYSRRTLGGTHKAFAEKYTLGEHETMPI